MIREEISEKVSRRLARECGFHIRLGEFCFWFCALSKDRDVEFALEELAASDDEVYKRGINIILEEVAADHVAQNTPDVIEPLPKEQ